jgi:hypothetical protein
LQGSKNFFFEKKKQKTFISFRPRTVSPSREAAQSFFASLRPDDGAAQPRSLNRAALRGSKKEVLAFFLVLAACGGPAPNYGAPTHLTCVPYARAVSGIQLQGDAWQWWDEADGVYPRGQVPQVGAVLVFKRRRGMESGHLAVVTAVTAAREILVTQSNWLPYRIEHDQPVEDVSAANDWSQVRVWYEPAHQMGSNVYETYGFVLPR